MFALDVDICKIMIVLRYLGLGLLAGLLFASCQKPETPVSLPPKTGSEFAVVKMGEDYTEQIFFDLETKSIVHTSPVKSWDLAFETGANDYHIFMNGGGTGVYVYNTHKTDITNITEPPHIKDNEWQFDQSSGTPDSTGIGEWFQYGRSKSEVYVVKLDPTFYPDTFRKIQILNVTANEYVMLFCNLRSKQTQMITIPKNNSYNYTYFTFADKGSIVVPEPPKTTWDIVFTRYRINYHFLNNFTYPVSGTLTNPYYTATAIDSSLSYDAINAQSLLKLNFSNNRDVIGYNWKEFKLDQAAGTSQFTVNKNKIYIIKTRKGQYYKLRFLDFYYHGVKGSPSFEFERIQ